MLYVTPNAREKIRLLHAQDEGRQRRRVEARAKRRLQSLGEARLQILADRAARILDAGEPTMFAFEGACRHGFRSRLVLEGWKWADADAASAAIVAAALHQLGAERPSWMDGQPEIAANWSVERFYCARCSKPIPEERRVTSRGHTVKYCSELCSDAAYQFRARRNDVRSSWAEHQANCAARSEQTVRERSGDCETCGQAFTTRTSGRRFCSRTCASASRQTQPVKPFVQCGTAFRDTQSNGREQKFCSKACFEASRKPRVDATCATCLTQFRPKRADRVQVYCSSACNPRAPRAERTNFRCEEIAE